MRDFLGDGYLSCRISGPIYMAAHRIVSIYRYTHTHTCLHELYGFGARIAHAEAPIRSTPAGLFQTPGGLLISEYNIPILLPLVILIPDCAGFPTLAGVPYIPPIPRPSVLGASGTHVYETLQLKVFGVWGLNRSLLNIRIILGLYWGYIIGLYWLCGPPRMWRDPQAQIHNLLEAF